jgi:MSHA biogenesis protein MshP
MSNKPSHPWRSQRGLGAIASLVIVVLLGSLAAAVVRLSWNAQAGVSQDVLSARAMHAANSGADWGLYKAFKGNWTTCQNAKETLDLTADTGFLVTVSCNSVLHNEGQNEDGIPQTLRIYAISAVACNGSGSCPDNGAVGKSFYVERARQVQATER